MASRSAQVNLLSGVELFAGLTKKEAAFRPSVHARLQLSGREGHGGGGRLRRTLLPHRVGTAVVTRNGRRIRKLGPGDSFGDIALIDGGPRSATVTAETFMSTLSWRCGISKRRCSRTRASRTSCCSSSASGCARRSPRAHLIRLIDACLAGGGTRPRHCRDRCAGFSTAPGQSSRSRHPATVAAIRSAVAPSAR